MRARCRLILRRRSLVALRWSVDGSGRGGGGGGGGGGGAVVVGTVRHGRRTSVVGLVAWMVAPGCTVNEPTQFAGRRGKEANG